MPRLHSAAGSKIPESSQPIVSEPGIATYRGRLAPSPTGYLHLGHARTFWVAQERSRAANGILILRMDDLDTARVRPEYHAAAIEDLRWLGLTWEEGPDRGGAWGPYLQSGRQSRYAELLSALKEQGSIYPCSCSRRDIRSALAAPHAGEEEPIYPGTCRNLLPSPGNPPNPEKPVAWRFRVSDGAEVCFEDSGAGPQRYIAGRDFGDFVVWRPDGLPAYQLACVADDADMGITEVVRGTDLLISTARQILVYRALGFPIPKFHHCPLMTDDRGVRLAKRTDALSLRRLREEGRTPVEVRHMFRR